MTKRAFFHSLMLSSAFFLAAMDASAQKGPDRPLHNRHAAIVVNAETDEVLYAQNADLKLVPASTTKMMTAYVVFKALSEGRVSFEDTFPVSAEASRQESIGLDLYRGQKITLYNALMGMLVHSANDASFVLAEGVGKTYAEKGQSSKKAFIDEMNRTARELGMTKTHFVNPNGLYHPQQYASVRDMARLMDAVVDTFPEFYPLMGVKNFTYKDQTYTNYNTLLEVYRGVDGGKTGTLRAAGKNLVASAQRGDDRIIAVVFGARSGADRHAQMTQLLNYGFLKLCDPDAAFPPRPGQDGCIEKMVPINARQILAENNPPLERKPVPPGAPVTPPKHPAKKGFFKRIFG